MYAQKVSNNKNIRKNKCYNLLKRYSASLSECGSVSDFVRARNVPFRFCRSGRSLINCIFEVLLVRKFGDCVSVSLVSRCLPCLGGGVHVDAGCGQVSGGGGGWLTAQPVPSDWPDCRHRGHPYQQRCHAHTVSDTPQPVTHTPGTHTLSHTHCLTHSSTCLRHSSTCLTHSWHTHTAYTHTVSHTAVSHIPVSHFPVTYSSTCLPQSPTTSPNLPNTLPNLSHFHTIYQHTPPPNLNGLGCYWREGGFLAQDTRLKDTQVITIYYSTM